MKSLTLLVPLLVAASMLLMTAATVVCVEEGLTFLASMGIRVLPLRVAVMAMACYSVAMGFMLGFVGEGDAFKRLHPELFKRIGDALK